MFFYAGVIERYISIIVQGKFELYLKIYDYKTNISIKYCQGELLKQMELELKYRESFTFVLAGLKSDLNN